MIRFICNKCNDTLELIKATIKNIDGKWRTEQAYCKKCDEWMQELEKDFNGFPNLIRTEPTLRRYTQGTYPEDFRMFLDLRSQNELVITPLPGYSTHGETAWLAPLINWSNI